MQPLNRLEPLLLLFAAGLGIGLVFPLSKYASLAGIDPFIYIGWSAAGASCILLALTLLFRQRLAITAASLRYAVIAGATTYAIPFGTLVFVVPHLGSGIPSIFQSLTAILTLGVVAMLGMEKPGLMRSLGLVLGLVGVLIIIASRPTVDSTEDVSALWIAAALVTPLSLAFGNVYRSAAWPEGQNPIPLAALTFAAAALLMLAVGVAIAAARGDAAYLLVPSGGVWVVVLQAIATGVGYAFFFRLQRVGGPVYLSQISYVNTAVGLGFAIALFAEPVNLLMAVALALIVVGVALVNRTFETR